MQALLTMLSLSKSDTAAILDEISVPSLIVMGTKDPDFSIHPAGAALSAR